MSLISCGDSNNEADNYAGDMDLSGILEEIMRDGINDGILEEIMREGINDGILEEIIQDGINNDIYAGIYSGLPTGTLTVYILGEKSRLTEDDFAYFNRVAELARLQGFNINFDFYMPISMESKDNFISAAKQDPNGAYFIWAPQIVGFDPGSLKNLDDDLQVYAPNAIDMAKHFADTGEVLFVPTNYIGYLRRLCVFIKNEIYDEYGMAINSIYEIEELLNWVKSKNSVKTPGYLLGSPGEFMLDLYFAKIGYTNLRSMFGLPNSLNSFYIYQWYNETTGGIYGLYDLQYESEAAVRNFVTWLEDGIITFSSTESNLMPLIDKYVLNNENAWDYPVIISNIDNIITRDTLSSRLGGYTAVIFNEPDLDRFWVQNLVYALPEADISVFLSFLEWLNTDIDNYEYIFYGIEGEDYGIINGDYISKYGSGYAVWANSNLLSLRNDKYDQIGKILSNLDGAAVRGLQESIERLESMVYPLDLAERTELAQELIDKNYPLVHHAYEYFDLAVPLHKYLVSLYENSNNKSLYDYFWDEFDITGMRETDDYIINYIN